MVALQTMATGVVAVGTYQAARSFQLPLSPQMDLAVKALVGVGLIVVSAALMKKDGWAKAVVIGAGVGLVVGSAGPYAVGLVR